MHIIEYKGGRWTKEAHLIAKSCRRSSLLITLTMSSHDRVSPRYESTARLFTRTLARINDLTNDEASRDPGQIANPQNLSSFSFIARIAQQTDRSPSLVAKFLLLSLFAILLVNPDNIAPYIANAVAFLALSASTVGSLQVAPAAHRRSPSVTITGRKEEISRKTSSARLLDAWVALSTTFMLESVLGHGLISYCVPIWWLSKTAWALAIVLSPAEDKSVKLRKPVPLVSACPCWLTTGAESEEKEYDHPRQGPRVRARARTARDARGSALCRTACRGSSWTWRRAPALFAI